MTYFDYMALKHGAARTTFAQTDVLHLSTREQQALESGGIEVEEMVIEEDLDVWKSTFAR